MFFSHVDIGKVPLPKGKQTLTHTLISNPVKATGLKNKTKTMKAEGEQVGKRNWG